MANCVACGVRQVVVVGAGLDTFALRSLFAKMGVRPMLRQKYSTRFAIGLTRVSPLGEKTSASWAMHFLEKKLLLASSLLSPRCLRGNRSCSGLWAWRSVRQSQARFRPPKIENEYIGEISDDVKTNLNRRAGAVSHPLREASDTLAVEASDIGAEVVDRVKQAGMDAAAAATAKVKSP